MANVSCDGIAERMDFDLECGDTAQCDYNATVSLGNGNTPGYSHGFDIDSRLIGESIFSSCTSISTLIGMAGVWSQVDITPMARIPLKWHLHLSSPCAHADYQAQQ